MFEQIEGIMEIIIEYTALFAELVGVIIIIIAFIKSFVGTLKKTPGAKLELDEGITSALGFMMCGEVLKTILIEEIKGLLILGAIMLLRAAMTFLLHWEMKQEKSHID